MEHTLTGTPLDEIQRVFLDLTAKIDAKVISVDDALSELRSHEVVDAAGFTWRIDPMTQSFIRRAPDAGATWKPADPTQYVEDASPDAAGHRATSPPADESLPFMSETDPFTGNAPGSAEPPLYAAPGIGVARPPVPAGRGKAGRATGKRGIIVAAAAVGIIGLVGAMGAVGRTRNTAAPTRLDVPRTTVTPRATPTVTQQAPPLSKAELARYQPGGLKAVPAAQQVLLTWTLPQNAQADGAGIIVRRDPAVAGAGISVLSRRDGRLPQTYAAEPLESGKRYCFLVGVLLQKATGGTALAQSGPICATPR